MPSFLPALQNKEGLECLRFNGNLTADQSEELVKLSGLRELTIDSCSWNVVDVFPRWMDVLRPTLMSLTLNVSWRGTHISCYVLMSAYSRYILSAWRCWTSFCRAYRI